MEALLQKFFGGRPNAAENVVNSSKSFFSLIASFVKSAIKLIALSFALSLTIFNVSAQVYIKLDTTIVKGTKVIIPNIDNLETLMWHGFEPMVVTVNLKPYGYVPSFGDIHIHIAKGTTGQYFVEIWEDAKNKFVRIVAVMPNYDWWPNKGLIDRGKEQDIDGWHCYIQKPDYQKGHTVFAVRPPKDDTLEVRAVYVKP
jgi:hypothetical protein